MTSNRRDAGFTVIELLMSVAILTVIVGAITSAMLVFFTSAEDVLGREAHSGGAITVASYVDRDLASADSVRDLPDSSCSGVSNALVLEWTQWVPPPGSLAPEPIGGTWTVAYAVVPDTPATAVDGTARYRLRRTFCSPTAPAKTSALLTDLRRTDDFLATVAAAGSCPDATATEARQVVVTTRSYGDDSTPSYSSFGCVKGRIR